MIVSEKITGTLYRLHLDGNNPLPDAQWFLTSEGHIKGLLIRQRATLKALREFQSWLSRHNVIGFDTAVESVEKVSKLWGFKRMEKI